MGYEIQKLLPRHYAILELCLQGLMDVEIASEMGMTPQAIGLIRKAPLFQDELARKRVVQDRVLTDERANGIQRAKQAIEEAAVDAVEVHKQLLHSDDDKLRQRSATDLLNFAFGSEKREAGIGQVVVINAANLENLQLALQESTSARAKLEGVDTVVVEQR